MGFLVYNSHPAKVFMGDTGSLCLGGTLASFCILTRHELLLILIGIIGLDCIIGGIIGGFVVIYMIGRSIVALVRIIITIAFG